ncbi:MAG: hypothetical protein AB1Z98_33140, partial [Nannocystaceae bacterium]
RKPWKPSGRKPLHTTFGQEKKAHARAGNLAHDLRAGKKAPGRKPLRTTFGQEKTSGRKKDLRAGKKAGRGPR